MFLVKSETSTAVSMVTYKSCLLKTDREIWTKFSRTNRFPCREQTILKNPSIHCAPFRNKCPRRSRAGERLGLARAIRSPSAGAHGKSVPWIAMHAGTFAKSLLCPVNMETRSPDYGQLVREQKWANRCILVSIS